MKVIPLDEEALDAVEFLGWDNLELMNQKLGKEYLFYIDTDDSYHHLVFDEEEEAVGSEEIDIEPELGDWFVFHEDGTLVILEEEDFLESYRPKNQNRLCGITWKGKNRAYLNMARDKAVSEFCEEFEFEEADFWSELDDGMIQERVFSDRF